MGCDEAPAFHMRPITQQLRTNKIPQHRSLPHLQPPNRHSLSPHAAHQGELQPYFDMLKRASKYTD